MDRNLIQKLLLGLFLVACIIIGVKKADFGEFGTAQAVANKPEINSNVSSSRMTYGRFLEYLEMGWVKQVDLYDNSRNAIVQASSPELGNRPQSIRVEIPVGASQLIQKLKEYNIDFDAHPVARKNIFCNYCKQFNIAVNLYQWINILLPKFG
jgi:cell division protease FtsH